jgi:hypothetical protein
MTTLHLQQLFSPVFFFLLFSPKILTKDTPGVSKKKTSRKLLEVASVASCRTDFCPRKVHGGCIRNNWVLTILKNMKVNGKDDIPCIIENKSHV